MKQPAQWKITLAWGLLGCRYGVIGFGVANLANSILYSLSYNRLSKEC